MFSPRRGLRALRVCIVQLTDKRLTCTVSNCAQTNTSDTVCWLYNVMCKSRFTAFTVFANVPHSLVLLSCCSLFQRRTSRYKGNVNMHLNAQNGWCNWYCHRFFSSSRLWSHSHFLAIVSSALASHMQTLPTVSPSQQLPEGDFKRTLWIFVFNHSCRVQIQQFLSNILRELHNVWLILYSLLEACLRSMSQSKVCRAVMVLYSCFIDSVSYSQENSVFDS